MLSRGLISGNATNSALHSTSRLSSRGLKYDRISDVTASRRFTVRSSTSESLVTLVSEGSSDANQSIVGKVTAVLSKYEERVGALLSSASNIQPSESTTARFSEATEAIQTSLDNLPITVESYLKELEVFKDSQVSVITQVPWTTPDLLQDIRVKLQENPLLEKLQSSLAKVIQSSFHLTYKLESSVESIQQDPALALQSTQQALEHALWQIVNDTQIQIVSQLSQPEVLPLAAVVAGTSLGVVAGNIIAWIMSEEGQSLPSRYNPTEIAAYFQRRPLQVAVRALNIIAQVSVLVSAIYLDRAQGTVALNERKRAKELVELITRLGPTAVKVGQALSIRPDLLSLAYLEELQTLQDRVPPFSNKEAESIIREGLGRSSDSIFEEMSSEPVAAASLGQVYKAKLKETGDVVAVKVQRPGVLEEISCDLFVLRSMATVLQNLPNLESDLEALLDNWANRFFDELDYVQEGKNAERFAKDMRLLKNVTVPTVFTKYSSRKVLTSEWVEGEKLSESTAPDLGSLVTTALNCYLIQLLETGFLHADPHPGNLLRTPDGKLCVLDYGLMTEVTQEQQYALIEYISHIVNSDYEAVANDLVVLGFVPPELVDPVKTAAVVPQLSRVLGQLVQGGGARYINIAQVTDDLSKMSEDYTFVIPPYFALILRAFGVLEGIGLDNDPNYAIVEECYPYISKRLITDDSPRARAALRYFLYGKSDRLNVERVESIVNGFQSFRELMAPVGGETVAIVPRRKEGVDPTAKEALQLVFSPQGSYLQELLLTEVVRSVDALSRGAQAAVWSFFASRVGIPLPASLTMPGSWPLPIPGMLGGIVRGDWSTARLSEEDNEQLLTVKRLWSLLEPELSQTATPASPADVLELVRDAVPVVGDLWPGMLTTFQRFVVMLFQRQALRFADDLDGSDSVLLWEEDPAAIARSIQPLWFASPTDPSSSV